MARRDVRSDVENATTGTVRQEIISRLLLIFLVNLASDDSSWRQNYVQPSLTLETLVLSV